MAIQDDNGDSRSGSSGCIVQRSRAPKGEDALGCSDALSNDFQRFVVFREAVGVQFGEHRLVIDADLEPSPIAWLQGDLTEVFVIGFDERGYQTGSSLAVASRGAVFEDKCIKHGSPFVMCCAGE
jgi:hypothetical protein